MGKVAKNLNRTPKNRKGGHGTLCQGAYDREYTEKMMGDLETAGFNKLSGAGGL